MTGTGNKARFRESGEESEVVAAGENGRSRSCRQTKTEGVADFVLRKFFPLGVSRARLSAVVRRLRQVYGARPRSSFGRNNQCIGALYLHEVQMTNMEISMSRAGIVALSFVAALAVSSAALAQGGGAGGGAGSAGSAAGGASGAAGTTGNASGARSGPGGASAAQPSGRSGQSGPTGNSAAQPPGSTGQNSINSPGTGVGPGSTPNAPSGTSGSSGQR
jgi:hypothetical protein